MSREACENGQDDWQPARASKKQKSDALNSSLSRVAWSMQNLRAEDVFWAREFCRIRSWKGLFDELPAVL